MPSLGSADAPDVHYRGRTVLVTGGLGFIGSNLAARLAACGARVTVLDALLPDCGGNPHNLAGIRDRVAVTRTDLRDAQALQALVAGKEFIFHLAGHVSHGDSMRAPLFDLSVNCVGTLNLLEACRAHNRSAKILYTSTRQVYGHPRFLPVSETHPAEPIDVNGINKLAAEYYHLLYDAVHGIHSTILRLTNTYGPRQKLDSDRQGVAAVFLRRALDGHCVQMYGDGSQLRDFNYVDDVVDALLRALAGPACRGQIFNLGATPPRSLAEFVSILKRHCRFDSVCVPFPAQDKQIEIGDYYGDYSRFTRATGWTPRVSLEDGLARTVAFHCSSLAQNGAGVAAASCMEQA